MILKIAYYFPGFHYDAEIYAHSVGPWSEWELVKQARPFSQDHYQPRVPLWGYEDETDREVMKRKLRVADEYAIDTLLFVSYWYGGPVFDRPFKIALDIASGGECSPPAMMWGNHNRYSCYPETAEEPGRLHLLMDYSWDSCKRMVDYWVAEYFSSPGYFRLPDGRLFFSIYSPQTIIRETGSADVLRMIIEYLQQSLKAYGLPAVHIHACETRFIENLDILKFGFDSCSDYLSLGYSENIRGKEPHLDLASLHGQLFVTMTAEERLIKIRQTFEILRSLSPIKYYPVVTVGRDCSPRVDQLSTIRKGHYSSRPILKDFHPEAFRKTCEVAREFVAVYSGEQPFIFFNAWNEWTEGAYLEPDLRFGYRFLEVIREVFGDC